MSEYHPPLGVDWPARYGMHPVAWKSLLTHDAWIKAQPKTKRRPCHRHIDPPQIECRRPKLGNVVMMSEIRT